MSWQRGLEPLTYRVDALCDHERKVILTYPYSVVVNLTRIYPHYKVYEIPTNFSIARGELDQKALDAAFCWYLLTGEWP